jgi:hypothetical protein
VDLYSSWAEEKNYLLAVKASRLKRLLRIAQPVGAALAAIGTFNGEENVSR